MRCLAALVLVLALFGSARGQSITDESAIFGDLLSRFTGGDANVTSGATYLYGLGTELAGGFQDALTDLYSSFLNGTEKDTIDSLIKKYQDNFCTNASYTPASTTPASFTGPGASLTISAGACVFNQTAFYSSSGDFEIDCVGPSVVIAKTPATFESQSKTPESFTSSSCSLATGIDDKLNATVGAAFNHTDIFGKAKPESSTEVLFVFDDKPDILNITQIGEQLQSQFESVLGQVNALVSGNGSLVLNGLSTSVGEPQPTNVTAVDATAPAIGFFMDELSHALP